MKTITLNLQTGRHTQRIFIKETAQPSGESLGYFEAHFDDVQRGGSTYDMHRSAKGDATSESVRIEWAGQEGVAAAVLDAVFTSDAPIFTSVDASGRRVDHNWRSLRNLDAGTLWRLMCAKCATGQLKKIAMYGRKPAAPATLNFELHS